MRDRLFSIIRARKASGGAKIPRPSPDISTYLFLFASLIPKIAVGKASELAFSVRARASERAQLKHRIHSARGDDDLSFRLSDFIQLTTLRDAIAFEAADATVSGDVKVKYAFQPLCVSHNNGPRKIERVPSSHLFEQRRARLYSTGGGNNNNLSSFCLSNLLSRPASPCSSAKYLHPFVAHFMHLSPLVENPR